METNVDKAKMIMGKNFIGTGELKKIGSVFPLEIPNEIPVINYSEEELQEKKDTHLLILFVPSFKDGTKLSLKSIRETIEKLDIPQKPVFYNQDWYLKESFYTATEDKASWLLLRKNIADESRGVNPDILSKTNAFPSALSVTYVFFVYYLFTKGEKLWNNDYVWCSDKDDTGDQIYVGKYTDPLGINADGFEIHRHLSIKMNYGVV